MILTREQYERRAENAAKRHENNKTITTLTEDQHDMIAEVCSMRHDIHSSGDELYHMQSLFSRNATDWLENINVRLLDVKLSEIPNIPRAEDFPTADDRFCGIIMHEDEEDNIKKFHMLMHELNNTIENWLARIDEEHSTNYCPTGTHRMMM